MTNCKRNIQGTDVFTECESPHTACIGRPAEFGFAQPKDVSCAPANTWHARDLLALADQLSG